MEMEIKFSGSTCYWRRHHFCRPFAVTVLSTISCQYQAMKKRNKKERKKLRKKNSDSPSLVSGGYLQNQNPTFHQRRKMTTLS